MNSRPNHNLEETNENHQDFISQGIQEILYHLDLLGPMTCEASPHISHEIPYMVEIEYIPQPTPIGTKTRFIKVRSPKFS